MQLKWLMRLTKERMEALEKENQPKRDRLNMLEGRTGKILSAGMRSPLDVRSYRCAAGFIALSSLEGKHANLVYHLLLMHATEWLIFDLK